MSSNRNLARAAGLVLLAIAVLGGCEDTEVIAPSDSTIALTANPNPVIFEAEEVTRDIDLSARLRSKDGFPQQGVSVIFTASAGTLASDGLPVTTNSDSIATDVLHLDVDDPEAIDVTATSGSLTQKITITKTIDGIAPVDGTLTVSAQPASVLVDPSVGDTKSTSIVALLKDKAGQPVPRVPVTFSQTAGQLESDTATTDVSGTASVELTLSVTDPIQVEVACQAGPLTATVTVAKAVKTAPADGVVRVEPNPRIIRIYQSNNETSGSSSIVATVVDGSGKGIPGISVQFGSTAGRLSATSVTTDNNGNATATLTMYVQDPPSADVTVKVFPLPDVVETIQKELD